MEVTMQTWRKAAKCERERRADETWHHQRNFYLWEHRKMKVAMEKMSWTRLTEESCKRGNVWNYGAMQHGERGAARVQKVSRVMHFIKWLNAHRIREGEHQKVRYMQSYRAHRAVRTWHGWFMAGRYMSDKGIRIATDAMDRLRKAKHLRRIRQHCSDARAREQIIRQLYRAAGCPRTVTTERRFKKCRCAGDCHNEAEAGSDLCERCATCTNDDCCEIDRGDSSGSQDDEDGPNEPSVRPKEGGRPREQGTTPEADIPKKMASAAQWGQPMQRRAMRRLRAGVRRSTVTQWRAQANARKYQERRAEKRREAIRALHHELEASERQEEAKRKEAEVLKTSLIMAEGIVMYQRMKKLTQHADPEATAISRWYERMREETKVTRGHKRALYTIAAELRKKESVDQQECSECMEARTT